MPIDPSATSAAADLMLAFAERTGLSGAAPQRRYLWTDAFAVFNFLALVRRTGDGHYLDLALQLVDRVHHVLGQHRPDAGLSGWLSGLVGADGEAHPASGGLRIGKQLPERRIDEPFDERLEWERDGQYFHYLTKWMHALDLVARSTGQPRFNLWARELAAAAHRGFVGPCSPGSRRHMYWKMSVDLSRSLVPSTGQHDPLDGFVTCIELRRTAARMSAQSEPSLEKEASDFASMIEKRSLATADPLGIGGLLMDAARIARIMGEEEFDGEHLMDALLLAALQGLSDYEAQGDLYAPAARRLAFRELGLAIGLSAVQLTVDEVESEHLRFSASARFADGAEALRPYHALRSTIVSFWTSSANRQARSWQDHRDINDVLLAASLVPEGCMPHSRDTDIDRVPAKG